MYEIDEKSARRELENFNEWIFGELFSSRELTIAVDFTVIPYYGEENPMLVSDSRLPGTNLGIKFAVLKLLGPPQFLPKAKKYRRSLQEAYRIASEE